MKKINLIPIYLFTFLLVFASCNSENDILDANLKIETETNETEMSETAFATCDFTRCFYEDGFKRWGWTNGPFTENYVRYDLWAGAGDGKGGCSTDKGEYVGRVLLWYNKEEKTAKVQFNLLSTRPWVLDETHFYIGANKYPISKNGKETVAPGQYPYKHSDLGGVKTDTYHIENLDIPDGEFYFIAHAVVSK